MKKALYYAADLAQRTHNPNHLVSAADQLLSEGYLERVGPLLDEAMPLVPHRFEPMVMSINLAQKTRDPKRMADAVESLLSLGWPGQDEYFRIESANQVETLAKSLREDGKGQEADQLLAKLTASQSRDLFVRLSWDGDADFDLLVDEPLGATASYQNPRTVFGGSILKNGYGSHPEEVYVCPRGFAGDYTIRVSHDLHQPRQAGHSLDAGNDHAGRDDRRKETDVRPQPRQAEQARGRSPDSGRRKKVLPYVDPVAELMKAAAPAMKNIQAARHRSGQQGQLAPKGRAAVAESGKSNGRRRS